MKTSSRVNHTVKEMPSRRHTKLSKGLKKSTILTSGRCWTLSNSWNQRAEQMIIEVRLSNSWPQVALIFCQKKAFMKITRGWGFSSHCSENQHKCMWPSWGCPLGQCHGISLFSPLICLWNSGEFNSRTRKVFEATVMKYRQVLDADVLLCLCKASRWRKKCKQWDKKKLCTAGGSVVWGRSRGSAAQCHTDLQRCNNKRWGWSMSRYVLYDPSTESCNTENISPSILLSVDIKHL